MSSLPLVPRIPPRAAAATRALGLAAFFALVGLLAAAQPVYAVALVVLAVGVAISISQPVALAFVGIVALSLVPTYAAPAVGPLSTYPAVLAGWGAALGGAIGAYARRERLGFTVVDAAVGLLLLSFSISVLVGARAGSDLLSFAWQTLGPFLGIRMLVARIDWQWIPKAFAAATLVALPFALAEAVTQTNVFTALQFNPAEASVWADLQFRFGTLRAEGAFGHAISLSQFAGTAILLALGAAVLAATRRARRWYLVVVLAGAVVLVLTFSRTGWLVVAVGIVLLTVGVVDGHQRRRFFGALAGAALLAALLLVATGLLDTVLRLVNDDSLSNSNTFREILIRRALNGEGIGFWGLENSNLGFGIDAGAGSIDNAWLSTAADWGWAGMGALMVVGVAVAVAFWRLRGTSAALVPAVTLANFLGLVYVAINTQTQFWLWMLVAATSGALVAARARPAPAEV